MSAVPLSECVAIGVSAGLGVPMGGMTKFGRHAGTPASLFLESLIFEGTHSIVDLLSWFMGAPSHYTDLERQIASAFPGAKLAQKPYLAHKLLPYSYVKDPVARNELQSELRKMNTLGKFDILELFNV